MNMHHFDEIFGLECVETGHVFLQPVFQNFGFRSYQGNFAILISLRARDKNWA